MRCPTRTIPLGQKARSSGDVQGKPRSTRGAQTVSSLYENVDPDKYKNYAPFLTTSVLYGLDNASTLNTYRRDCFRQMGHFFHGNEFADCSTPQGGPQFLEQKRTEETEFCLLWILSFQMVRVVWQQVLVLVELAAGRAAGQ
jgi:hypothetical protein